MKGWFPCITSPAWALYPDWEALLQWEMEYDMSRRRACTLGEATVLETLRLHDYSWIDQRIKNRNIWKWGQPKERLLWEHGCLFFFNSLIRSSRISFPKCLDLHSLLSCFCALAPRNTGLQQNVSTSSSSWSQPTSVALPCIVGWILCCPQQPCTRTIDYCRMWFHTGTRSEVVDRLPFPPRS